MTRQSLELHLAPEPKDHRITLQWKGLNPPPKKRVWRSPQNSWVPHWGVRIPRVAMILVAEFCWNSSKWEKLFFPGLPDDVRLTVNPFWGSFKLRETPGLNASARFFSTWTVCRSNHSNSRLWRSRHDCMKDMSWVLMSTCIKIHLKVNSLKQTALDKKKCL